MSPEPDITQLLVAWTNGDQAAFDRLAPAVHQQLHRLAAHYMAGERPGHVLHVSVGTVRRDWTLAQAWLYRELSGGGG